MTVIIDGSYGEGGGQVIRTSLSLAAITGKAVEIRNVRARRTKPGLQPQHRISVRAAGSICAARIEGDEIGSSRVVFEPQSPVQPGRYLFDIQTAGAAPLVVQTLLLPLALAEGDSALQVRGGTHVPHAPPAEYLETIYVPALAAAGIEASVRVNAAGFYPRGGGEIQVVVRGGTRPRPLDLTERGKLADLRAYITTALLPDHVAERGAATVETAMRAIGRRVTVERRALPSPGPGAAVSLIAVCQNGRAGFNAIGERGKPMETVTEAACKPFMPWWKSGTGCDEHLADQLVLPMALAEGISRWTTPTVTGHLRTVLWVVQQFLPVETRLEEQPGGGWLVEVTGG